MRESIQAATANISAPNSLLTRSIQGPALGNNLPAEAPTISSGVPMPNPIANRAMPPRSMLPLWPMKSSAPTSAGATQVVTMSADNAPMTATPP